jgi:hypothetical protein
MIEINDESLVFSFPEVHPSAKLTITFQRTLRIPDDDKDYPLPPALGSFPVRHVDDYASRVPASWSEHGGVMLPMYQSEAMWLNFSSGYDDDREAAYPFAVKIATGKVNAVSGGAWTAGLHREPEQDYVIVPRQPWLDGYCVKKGIIRQFVAMPLGSGYTAEEQITGKAEHGGLQIMVIPMKKAAFERYNPIRERARFCSSDETRGMSPEPDLCCCCESPSAMSLAPGGRMKQEIYEDYYKMPDWEKGQNSRCFVHIANSMTWRQITDEEPPKTPCTSGEYARRGMPWFMWYDDKTAALPGSKMLAGMKSIATLGKKKKDVPLPENQSVTPMTIIPLGSGSKTKKVREFSN